MLGTEKLAEKMAKLPFSQRAQTDALHGIKFYLKSTCGTGQFSQGLKVNKHMTLKVEPQKLQVNQIQKKSKHFEEIKLISLNSLLHVTNDGKHNSDPQEDN